MVDEYDGKKKKCQICEFGKQLRVPKKTKEKMLNIQWAVVILQGRSHHPQSSHPPNVHLHYLQMTKDEEHEEKK